MAIKKYTIERKIFLLLALLLILAMPTAMAEINFAVTSFSCTPSEVTINNVFSCTAQIKNTGTEIASVSIATLYPDSNNWLESSNYPQASGTSVDPGNSVEVTFTGLRATKSGTNGFSKIMLNTKTDNYVATENVEVNVIDVIVTVANSASSAAMSATFDSTAEVTAGGNIDAVLTFTVDSGGCSIGSQDASKTISGMQNGNKQSRVWSVTMGSSGTCRYTISAATTGSGGIASKIDSTSSSVACTNCPTSSSSSSSSSGGSGAGGGGGGVGTVVYTIGELGISQAVELGKGEAASFNINGENHSITLKNLTETQATILIKSEAQIHTLALGDEKSIDINSDSVTDFFVKLKSINIIKKKATFILRPLVEKLPEEAGAGAIGGAAVNQGGNEGGIGGIIKNKTTLIWAIIVLIIVVIVCIIYLIKRRKHLKWYYGH